MMMKKTCVRACTFILLLGTLFRPAPLLAEPLTLQQVVGLALQHATGVAIAAADVLHASAGYRELRNSYIPQLTAGAGLGWSDGFPLSLEGAAPSLFNVNAQSALVNPALKYFIRAARSDIAVGTLRTKDQRGQVIQDAVLSYAELAKWDQRLNALGDAQAAAAKMEAAVAQRVKEGIDSELEGTRARLSVARLRLRFAEASGAADVLREHLSKLTGLPVASIEIAPESVPPLPVEQKSQEIVNKSSAENPNVQAAVEHARAQYLRVKGERKSLWFPFLNYAQHARVQEAESDALKAAKQAEAVRNQVSEETLRLQRAVTQMQAAHDVAELEYEIAQKNIEAVQTRMGAGTANLHDLDNARTQASERFIALQDVTFELERIQVSLLRATGDLESWALGMK